MAGNWSSPAFEVFLFYFILFYFIFGWCCPVCAHSVHHAGFLHRDRGGAPRGSISSCHGGPNIVNIVWSDPDLLPISESPHLPISDTLPPPYPTSDSPSSSHPRPGTNRKDIEPGGQASSYKHVKIASLTDKCCSSFDKCLSCL
jgi:hypothetical protein